MVAHVGAELADAVTRQGGYTPGCRGQAAVRDDSRTFVKATAASLIPDSAAMLRREAAIAARLDDPAIPRLLTVVDDGDWIALLFEHAPGDHPRVRWGAGRSRWWARRSDTCTGGSRRHRSTHRRCSTTPTTTWAGGRFADVPDRAHGHGLTADDIERFATTMSHLGHHLDGATLLHGDLPADQILVAGMRTSFVDWPHARIGPAWADLALMIPSMLAADRRLDVDSVVSLSAELRADRPRQCGRC